MAWFLAPQSSSRKVKGIAVLKKPNFSIHKKKNPILGWSNVIGGGGGSKSRIMGLSPKFTLHLHEVLCVLCSCAMICACRFHYRRCKRNLTDIYSCKLMYNVCVTSVPREVESTHSLFIFFIELSNEVTLYLNSLCALVVPSDLLQSVSRVQERQTIFLDLELIGLILRLR